MYRTVISRPEPDESASLSDTQQNGVTANVYTSICTGEI